jgi:hypothetical protein
VLLVTRLASAADAPEQKRFARPAAALSALVEAVGKDDKTAMLAILGSDAEEVVSSGDEVEDAGARKRFVASAHERTRFETLDQGHAVAHLGKDDWPFPIPLVKDAEGWRFDTAAGKDELLNRRIGRNELAAIAVAREFVDAQREYASKDRGDGVGVYAQRLLSTPGKRDGLYWEDPAGNDESPMGPLVAKADAEGYAVQQSAGTPQVYHGYFFRLLTGQGEHAPGGARSYVKDGRMTGGFALVAWPAEPGNSGVMTFIVGPQGIVFEKNLGAQTAELAKAMTTFDPDPAWTPVR